MLIKREPHRRAEIVANRLRRFQDGMEAALAGIRALAESEPILDVTIPSHAEPTISVGRRRLRIGSKRAVPAAHPWPEGVMEGETMR